MVNWRAVTISISVSLLPASSMAQPVLQPQSQEDFSRVLSPGIISRDVTLEKLQQLRQEASKDCFDPDSFQRAVPALPVAQNRPCLARRKTLSTGM
jgi:hypothetical protein